MIRAGTLYSKSTFTRQIIDVEASIASLRQAKDHWDGIGQGFLSRALMDLIILRAQESSPALRSALDAAPTTRNLPLLAYLAFRGPSGQEVARAIQQQPELRQVSESLSVALQHRRPAHADWMIAQLIGDAELVALTAPVLSSEPDRLSLEMNVRLAPSDRATVQLWEIIRAQ